MQNLKLFRIESNRATQLDGYSAKYEKRIQVLFEQNLEVLLGVRFVDTEFRTDKEHRGRIDTIGIDENGCPVVIEYKRSQDMNVINQGLYYLDWLVNHQGDFEMLVLKKIGQEAAESVEWSGARLVCIAGGFSKFDEYAINQMIRNIDLIQYERFGGDLLVLQKINGASTHNGDGVVGSGLSLSKNKAMTAADQLDRADSGVANLFGSLREYLAGLGDDVEVRPLKRYFAFKRIKNFACIGIQPKGLLIYVRVDPDNVELKEGFTRDVRNLGHFGTGDLEIRIKSIEQIEAAKQLFEEGYENA
ncbi:MAG: DUF91 domain-containing protein [Gammaproteobacteria bacterium]|nr:DUF91 domain-containing protein [Gammaproteobacteria bacterium]